MRLLTLKKNSQLKPAFTAMKFSSYFGIIKASEKYNSSKIRIKLMNFLGGTFSFLQQQ